jgi:hypothetical protein
MVMRHGVCSRKWNNVNADADYRMTRNADQTVFWGEIDPTRRAS